MIVADNVLFKKGPMIQERRSVNFPAVQTRRLLPRCAAMPFVQLSLTVHYSSVCEDFLSVPKCRI